MQNQSTIRATLQLRARPFVVIWLIEKSFGGGGANRLQEGGSCEPGAISPRGRGAGAAWRYSAPAPQKAGQEIGT